MTQLQIVPVEVTCTPGDTITEKNTSAIHEERSPKCNIGSFGKDAKLSISNIKLQVCDKEYRSCLQERTFICPRKQGSC